MGLLETFVATQVFAFMVIFARIGSALMVMPGISDTTVPMEIRLFVALAFSFILIPVLQPMLPHVIPQQPIAFALLISHELLIGLFIGLMSQVMMNAMNLAGVIVAHTTSLSSAFTFNPQLASQSSVVNSFLSMIVIVMIFVTDLHHMLFLGLIDSYHLFPTTVGLMFGDMANSIAEGIGHALMVGLMISAPFLIVSLGIFLAMGLVARLVPQIQVFIMSIPVQVLTGLVLLMTSVSAMLLYFLGEYEAFWKTFLQG